MGLFDSYFDPQQFQDGGGLLGRLLSLQGQQGQYQPDALADDIAGLGSGQRTGPNDDARQDLHSRYLALRPILGDRNAMLAIVNPEVGQILTTQALARQTKAGNTGDVDRAGNDQAGFVNETNQAASGPRPRREQAAELGCACSGHRPRH
jgi:hypothetical protein